MYSIPMPANQIHSSRCCITLVPVLVGRAPLPTAWHPALMPADAIEFNFACSIHMLMHQAPGVRHISHSSMPPHIQDPLDTTVIRSHSIHASLPITPSSDPRPSSRLRTCSP